MISRSSAEFDISETYWYLLWLDTTGKDERGILFVEARDSARIPGS